MTPEQLDEIRARMQDSTTKWNSLLAQDDRSSLLSYVEELEAQLATQPRPPACPSCGAAMTGSPTRGAE